MPESFGRSGCDSVIGGLLCRPSFLAQFIIQLWASKRDNSAVLKRASDRANCSREIILGEWFVEFCEFGGLADWKLRISGGQDNGHVGLLGPDRLGQLHACHPRHKLIRDHEVDGSFPAKNPKRLLARCCLDDLVTEV